MALSDEQSKIIALEAKLSKFGNSGSKSNSNSNNNSSTKKDQKSKSPNSTKGGKKSLPSWMTQYPGKAFVDAGLSKVKDGRTYWWCKKHKRFCMHKTSECRLTSGSSNQQGGQGAHASSANTSSGNSSNSNSNQSSTPSIRVSMATMMNE